MINKTHIVVAIGAVLIIGGAVLDVFYNLRLLGDILDILGCLVIILYFAFRTRKFIKNKDRAGKMLRIGYIVGFLVVATGIVLSFAQGDYLIQEKYFGRYLVFWGFLGMAIYLMYMHDKICKKANDDTEKSTV